MESSKINLSSGEEKECQTLNGEDLGRVDLNSGKGTFTKRGSEEYSDYSFQNFVRHFQNLDSNLNASWNKERQSYFREANTKKKIILKEINQFDSKDPLKTLDDAYSNDIYNTNLLVNEMKNVEGIFSERTYDTIIEKREKLEMTKKILEHYLDYVVEINFDSISKN